MSLNVLDIQTLGDDRRRDSTSGTIDTSKKLRAVQSALREVHSAAHWEFTRRRKAIDIYRDETDYEIVNVLGISDFKDVSEVAKQDVNNTKFEYLDSDDFDLKWGNVESGNYFAVEKRSGSSVFKVRASSDKPTTLLGDMSSLSGNGTWSGSGDALNVALDDKEYRFGNSSIKFDIDVSQSGSNYADIDVTLALSSDLSDYENIGAVFGWIYLPTVSYITGASLFIGTDQSNYVLSSTTSNSQEGAFVPGWNRVKFSLKDVSQVGTPDFSDINYIKVRISYSASQIDTSGFRINGFEVKYPERLDFIYYSSAIVIDSNGDWQPEINSTSDTLIIPDLYQEVIANGYTANLLMQMGKYDEATMYDKKFRVALGMMRQEFAVNVKNEVKAFSPRIPWPK